MSSIQSIPHNLLTDWCLQSGGLNPSSEKVQQLATLSFFELMSERQQLKTAFASRAATVPERLQLAKEEGSQELSKAIQTEYALAAKDFDYQNLIRLMMVHRASQINSPN